MELIRQLSEDDWRELLRLVRRRLPISAGSSRGAAEKLNSKRFMHRIRRRMIKAKHAGRIHLRRDTLLWMKMKECPILDGFFPERNKKWRLPAKRKAAKRISFESFSLIDNPRETFDTMHAIARAESESRDVFLDFTDEYCIDISPYLVLGLMRQNMAPVVGGGRITPQVISMAEAVGLSQLLRIPRRSPDATRYKFWAFPVRHRRGATSSDSLDVAFQPSAKEKLNDDLVETLDDWLTRRKRPKLTTDQRSSVARMIGEVLDNAERHSGPTKREGDWAIAGFSAPTTFERPDGSKPTHDVVSLATVSIGTTIAESMESCEDERTVALIEDYVAKYGKSYPRDLLTTVYALQDRISRFKQDRDRPSGGIGMLDMVEFANEMGIFGVEEAAPSVTLISGRSCVMIRPPYGRAPAAPQAARRLWFNANNSLEEPPSPDHVFTLPYRFPGTIVAVRFCIATEDGEVEK